MALRIGIIIDHPNRDLLGAALLGLHLAWKGHRVFMIPMYAQGVEVPLLDLDILVINYARPTNYSLVLGYSQQGIDVYVLDTEGGVVAEGGANSPERQAEYLMNSGFQDIIAGYFLWGTVIEKSFVKLGLNKKFGVYVTGCPRFDFTSYPWRSAFRDEKRAVEYLLINTGFPAINPRFSSVDGTDKQAMRQAGWEDGYIAKTIEDLTAAREGLLQFVNNVSESLSDYSIVVRPHPFESSDLYVSTFKNHKNVIVSQQGNILEVLSGAFAVVHINSTTAIEAIMMKVPPISLDYLATDHLKRHSSLPREVSYRALSESDAVRAIEDVIRGGTIIDYHDLQEKHIEPWFYRVDGRSSERITRVLSKKIKSERKDGKWLWWSVRSSRAKVRFSSTAWGLFSNIVGPNNAIRLREICTPSRRAKQISINNITHWINVLTELQQEGGVEVKSTFHPLTKAKLSSVLLNRAQC